MATKQSRGTKRTCQNGECGSRFYDLDRSPIVCPVCQSGYEIASAPLVLSAADKAPRKPKRPEGVIDPVEAVEADPAVVADEDLAVVAGDDEEPVAAEADETFLEEEEEDGGDVSNILGGPVAEGDEEV